MTYRRVPTGRQEKSVKEIGPVLHFPWANGEVEFRCPCGVRTVFVTPGKHGISFDEDERLTVDGSIAITENGQKMYGVGYCHFHIKDGEVEMCGDSKCPGAGL